MSDHSVEPSMARVAVLPWPEMEGCYLVLSGKLRKIERAGSRWYVGHEEVVKTFDDDVRSEPAITFTYVEDGIAAEWDGDSGPIQLWYKCAEGYKDGYDEAREHWLWPHAFGAGHWSQMAVEESDLPRRFNRGDWKSIFSILKSWVRPRIEEKASALDEGSAPVDTLPKGRDGEAGSVRSKGSAVGEAEAPNLSPNHTRETGND